MSTKTRFEKEAKGNSEMVYYIQVAGCCTCSGTITKRLSFNSAERIKKTYCRMCVVYIREPRSYVIAKSMVA